MTRRRDHLTYEERQASRLAADLSRLPIKSRLAAIICSTTTIDELDQIARALTGYVRDDRAGGSATHHAMVYELIPIIVHSEAYRQGQGS